LLAVVAEEEILDVVAVVVALFRVYYR